MDLLEQSEENPKPVAKILSHTNSVLTCCFSPDQTRLCSAGQDMRVILTKLKFLNFESSVECETEKEFRVKKVNPSETPEDIFNYAGPNPADQTDFNGSEFSSDGSLIATSCDDSTVQIWTVDSEDGNMTKLEGHTDCVNCLKFMNDSRKIITGGDDWIVKIWDIEIKKDITSLKGCKGFVFGVDMLPDDNTILSGDFGNGLNIWDARSGECVKELEHHSASVLTINYCPKTYSLASGSSDNTTKITDVRTYKVLHSFKESETYSLSVFFHPSGRYLVSGYFDSVKTVRIYDLEEKNLLHAITKSNGGQDDSVFCVRFSPDGKYFATGCYDDSVFLWNFPQGRFYDTRWDEDENERVRYLIDEDFCRDDEEYDFERVIRIKFGPKLDQFCVYRFFF